jgi:hypothetical protein
MRNASVIAAAMLASAVFAAAGRDHKVAYPTQYRGWTHVKSTLVGPQNAAFATNGGLHHFYANEKGVEGYRNGVFRDGAVLIDDLLATKDIATPGISVEGQRRRLAVMVKNGQRYAATGGWGFEIFVGESHAGSLGADGRAACFACHQKAKNAVFSEFRK